MITDLCDFSSAWGSRNARVLDECSLSSDQLIELFHFYLAQEQKNIPFLGTTNPTSYTFCWNIPYIAKANPYNQDQYIVNEDYLTAATRTMYTRMFDYFFNKGKSR